ncbi:methyltransferase [Salix suchowensis]|nr:methyltransferase [Salix suchowensis]
MEGLFDKQAAMYLTARPGYPRKWFSKLAALSPHHYLAWDIGIGNGQATIGVAEHYKQLNAGCEDFGSFSPVNTASYEANCGFVVRGGCLRSSSVLGKVLIWLELSAKSLAGKMKL